MKKPEPIRVKISEFHVAKTPAILRSHGLGSCVGVIIYDPAAKIGGLAHVLLPSSRGIRQSSSPDQNPFKFADLAIEEMKNELIQQGCDPKRLVAKIAGGANMFSHRYNVNPGDVIKPGIGKRNVQAARKKLKDLGIALVAEDVGGETGRTLEFDTESGKMHISSSTGITKII
jgi:chemotaxis protein CheD